MQFHATLAHGGSERHAPSSVPLHAKKPPHQVPDNIVVQPGSLRSLQPRSNNQRLASQSNGHPSKPTSATTKQKKALTITTDRLLLTVAEPINYLKLRRTEHSKHALLRNRQVAREILAPSLSPTKDTPSSSTSKKAASKSDTRPQQPHFEFAAPVTTETVLDVLQRKCRDRGEHVDAQASITATMQQLVHEQQKLKSEAHQESSRLQHLLTDIRNDISLRYKMVPLCKIYRRHKLAARWGAWRTYVVCHRTEQQRLELLAPFAVHIQRVFRRKRTKWIRARKHLELAWTHWQAAIVLQSCVRRWLWAKAQMRRREREYATRIQAAWRGRKVRRHVKKALQDQLRWLLASLTPTGNLHRLHEITRNHPQLAMQVNYMLTLITETHVAVERSTFEQHRPKHASFAAKHYTKPVEATRQQLFHAIHETKRIIQQRDQEIAATKQAFMDAQHEKRAAHDRVDAERKQRHLRATKERIKIDEERAAMANAERETREYLRAMLTAAADARLRQQLKAQRREQAETSLMIVEEYQTRYIVTESRRRELECRQRLHEIAKREQFLHEQAQNQLKELLVIMQEDEHKRLELQQKKAVARAAEQAKWAALSKDERAEALRRLEFREQQRLAQQLVLDAETQTREAVAKEALRQKERLRMQTQQRLAQELQERLHMDREEKWTRRYLFALKKHMHAASWQEKREKKKVKYSIDPLHFAKVQQQKEQYERERREAYLMTSEDALAHTMRDKENQARYFEQCREKKRMRLIHEANERKERAHMEAEEQYERNRLLALSKTAAFRAQLHAMQELAERDARRERDRISEAKHRNEMHEEELWQRRVQQTRDFLDKVREKQERQAMAEEERVQLLVDVQRAKLEAKRVRTKRNLAMMKEDVASMERHDWEDEGARLEHLLWTPFDAAAFTHFVTQYPLFLRTNVEVLQEIVQNDILRGPPPFELDYDTVIAHLVDEHDLPLDNVPFKKKRKPRKFFYHEFFEDDPILSKLVSVHQPPPPSAASAQARARWQRLGQHFFGHLWSSDAARKGYLHMHNAQYEAAIESLLTAMQHNGNHKAAPPGLVRQLGRCYVKQWEATVQRIHLEKALFYFQQASAHVFLLTRPSFLQELAAVLEHLGKHRAAAEILGGIISCFPRYARLHDVIFRGAIVMVTLQMYRQAREYLLHVLDARPFALWEPCEIQFLAARILQFEGPLSKQLCAVAYEDAFRRRNDNVTSSNNKRDHHATWQEWIQSTETWRRFGDLCFARREFVLAKDAYEMMLKRQTHKPAHLMSKRQQVQQRQQLERAQQQPQQRHEDNDWLRLARVCALLNDRSKTVLALRRWLAHTNYRDRVREQYYQWPLVRWKLLGLTSVPESIIHAREAMEYAREEAKQQRRHDIEAQRQEALRRRSAKSRVVRMAWQDDGQADLAVATDSDLAVAEDDASSAVVEYQVTLPWHRIASDDDNEAYYWNEETDETTWKPPIGHS